MTFPPRPLTSEKSMSRVRCSCQTFCIATCPDCLLDYSPLKRIGNVGVFDPEAFSSVTPNPAASTPTGICG